MNSDENTLDSSGWKDKGNTLLQSGKFSAAIECYSKAISLDKNNHVLYSNRSVAYTRVGQYEEALDDANKAIELKKDWVKGYIRKGSALQYLGKVDEALKALQEGVQYDPRNDELDKLLSQVKLQIATRDSLNNFNPFQRPELFMELRADPRTKPYLSDAEFVNMMKELRDNPSSMGQYLKDERVMAAMTVMLDASMKSAAHGEPDDVSPPKRAQTESKRPEPMNVDLSDNQRQALKEKDLGNAEYKKKNFEQAIEHYSAAVKLDGSNMIYLSNIAAVHFEQKEYGKCIEQCEKAIDIGRENRADFKLIAKAFTRIANSYKKLGDLIKAKTYFEKSMSEHRTPEVKALLSQVEKEIKEMELKAYIDPVKAEAEKELGNELFKKGDFATAMKHYTEAIKRNPEDPKYYSNRAACYTKLAAFDLGLKDCEKCVELDPKFIKGWIRKGKILQGMQQHGKALTAYQKALELDSNNAEALEGYRSCVVAVNSNPEEVRKRAMGDPEIQAIMKDPAMRLILEQMQSDPKALQDHLKNPEIAAKIQKLLESGLIAIR